MRNALATQCFTWRVFVLRIFPPVILLWGHNPKGYTEPALLICDELGYLALDQQTSNLF